MLIRERSPVERNRLDRTMKAVEACPLFREPVQARMRQGDRA